jgi:Ca-activated chloride channel family protein
VRFANPFWLFGTALAALVAALLVLGGWLLLRSVRRFGDEPRVLSLVTGRASTRRVIQGVLTVLAVASAFIALARPQYGRGTRLIPATNLDVVVALDYSKSMYARDVSPSRTLRAKSEVSRLISELRGARFGAVAFAGEPMTFPLTSDGAAIAQFFRQLTPNDMPVGGTSLARAIAAGQDLFKRDPSSEKHAKILVLVTDGEDLEGDPAAVAKAAHDDGITVDVVQIGGRTPEPIPDVDESGRLRGWRKDSQGNPLTTALTAEGEAQLAETAKSGGGFVVRSATGTTGIDKMARELSRYMSSELSEKVETVYADVYAYPLALTILLLLAEVFVGQTKRRSTPAHAPEGPSLHRPQRGMNPGKFGAAFAKSSTPLALVLGMVLPFGLAGLTSCEGGLKDPFIRRAPDVQKALTAVDAGDAGAAVDLLEHYLSTGKCSGGNIGTPDSIRTRHNAAFDLGLALFQIAEKFGGRFGEPSAPVNAQQNPATQQLLAQRSEQVECALRVVLALGDLPGASIEFRARANYLAGNLYFLREEYKNAVKSYDLALRLIPGVAGDKGDAIGRDSAWNRALALEHSERQPPDAGDGGQQNPGDGGANNDAGDNKKSDAGNNNPDGGNSNKPDKPDEKPQQPDAGSGKNNQPDAGMPPPEPPKQDQQASRESQNQDDRILDELEQTPSLHEHMAKENAQHRRGVVRMEDK